MNIVLVTLHVRRSRQAIPLGAACLAAALPEGLRRRTRLVDLYPDQGEEQTLAAILEGGADLVSFSLFSWNRDRLCRLARALRRRAEPCTLVAGGPEATADAAGTLEEGGFDGVIRGEGELPFARLCQALAAGESPAGLAGISWREADGVVAGPDAPPAAAEELPSPWLTGVLTPQREGGVLWESARGCPFACDYCFDGGGRSSVRHLPPARLRAELELFARCGVAQVWVLDSTFNFPPRRGKDLLAMIRQKAPNLHYHLEAKADFLDDEMIGQLAQIDCSLQLGLQSIHPQVLHNIGRGFDAQDFRRKAERLNVEGVIFGLDLIYGLPGDSHEGFRDSLDAALALAPNHLDLFRLAVLPGTALHRHRTRFGLQAAARPPYEVERTDGYGAEDLQRSELLAAATRIFYNTGRAVGFYLPLADAAGMSALGLMDAFLHWVLSRGGVAEDELLRVDDWEPLRVLQLQERFVSALLGGGKRPLSVAALDLLHYHYHYAETLLGPEVLPAEPETVRGLPLLETAWRRNPNLRLVPFSYEIADLLETGAGDLRQIVRLFKPVGSIALFLRRGAQVACESLEEEFCRLLQESDGRNTPRRIFPSPRRHAEVEQWLDFAIAEGLLLPPASATA